MIKVGNTINTSNIKCPDGAVLSVTISEGRSQVSDADIVVIGFTHGGECYQTWMAEYSSNDARIAKILFASKHSPEFRESLKIKEFQYPETEALQTLLGQFDKPAFVELIGNMEEAPVHEEMCSVINFPDGFPKGLEKHANKARWLSVRKGGGENRLRVYSEYGHAHTYNKRLLAFLEGVLTNSLKRSDYDYLGLPSATTVLNTAWVKRPHIAVSADVLTEAIQKAASYPLTGSRWALLRLKTGRDSWSGMKGPELLSHIKDPSDLKKLQGSFKEEKDRLTAIRWHLRGLPASYAIFKTQLDLERSREYSILNS